MSEEEKKKKRVFISHSSKNKPFVEKDILEDIWPKVKPEVKELGYFYDKEHIGGGDRFRETITKNVKGSKRLLAVMSKECLESEWVKAELEIGVEEILLDEENKADARRVHNKILPVKINERDKFGDERKKNGKETDEAPKEANPKTVEGGTTIAFNDVGNLFIAFHHYEECSSVKIDDSLVNVLNSGTVPEKFNKFLKL